MLLSNLPFLLLLLGFFASPSLQQSRQSNEQHDRATYGRPPRQSKVAIIGAGPGGTSAAYFLSRAQAKLEALGRGNEGFEITVFEREERVGGRTQVVHPYDDESLDPVELGASIFAGVNMNLQRAAKDFDLATDAKLGENGAIGIWDGQQFLIEGLDNSWWNSARMLWRYGYSPMKVKNLVADVVSKFIRLYDPTYLHKTQSQGLAQFRAQSVENSGNSTSSGFPWSSIEEVAKAMELSGLANVDAGDYFYEQGVSKLFVEEVIEAASLVNYGQEIYAIHGVGGHVSLAASGAKGVRGGNTQIFQEMLGRSGARLKLGVQGTVTGLARFDTVEEAVNAGKLTRAQAIERGFAELEMGDRSTKWWLGTKSGFGDLYDYVFIAAPWHSAGITLLNTRTVIPSARYVHLHVTILVTDAAQPDPRYFGRGEKDAVPTTVLTSRTSLRKIKAPSSLQNLISSHKSWWAALGHSPAALVASAIAGWWPGRGGDNQSKGPVLEFNSLGYLAQIPGRHSVKEGEESPTKEHVVKIFSEQEFTDEHLEAVFGAGRVHWVHRKEWDAYPYLTPRTSFAPLQPDRNLFFLNAFEGLISTMETSTVSARNAVALVLQSKLGFDFVHGGTACPWEKEEKVTKSDEDTDDKYNKDWADWGCKSG